MLVGLNVVVVLWTMVERQVEWLKWWAHLLCDYIRVEDQTHEVLEELKSDAVMEWVAGLVGTRTIVVTENAIVAFLGSHCADLVSRLFSRLSTYPRLALVT